MKKVKIIVYGVIALFLLIFAAACQKKDEPKVTVGSDGTIQGELTEGLEANLAEIPAYDQQLKRMKIQEKEIDPVFIKEKVFPMDDSAYTIDRPEGEVVRLITEDGLVIVNSSGSTKAWDQYNDFIHFRTAEDFHLETSTDGELGFQSREDTEKQMRKLAEDLGISFEVETIHIEAYTGEYFTELIEAIGENKIYVDFVKPETLERNWSEADDVYYAEITFAQEGIPVEKEDITLRDDTFIQGLKMQVYLTEEGIQSFDLNPLAFADISQEEEIEIIGIPEGIETVMEKYENIVSEEKVEIVNSQVTYMFLPEGMGGDLYLIPVIRFDTRSTVLMNSTESSQPVETVIEDTILVNGQTGRILE